MREAYMSGWRDIHKVLKKKYPELTKDLNEQQLNEEIDLDKYVEDWLGRGGVHDDNSINRVFVSKLKQLGYEDFGTIYRILYVKNAPKIPDLKKYIWTNYNGKYISFSKTLEGAKNFMDQLINDDLLEKGETFVIIKQKSPYYDLSGWVEDKIAEAGGPWAFATVKDYWTEGLYSETQKTQEVLAVLNNNFEIEGRYSKKGKPLTEGRYDKFTNELSRLAFELFKDGYTVGRKVVDETFTVFVLTVVELITVFTVVLPVVILVGVMTVLVVPVPTNTFPEVTPE